MRRSRRWSLRPNQGLLAIALPYVLLGVTVLAFYILPSLSDRQASTYNVYDTLQVFADLGLLSLALGLTMIAGEFDLSIVGMYGLGAMVAVKCGSTSPVLGIVVAVFTGLVSGLIQGSIIARLRMNSMTVTLGGYLILLGITGVLGSSKNVQYTNFEVGAWLDQHICTVLSPRSITTILIFVAALLLLRWTRVGTELKAVGGERRAGRTTGVAVDRYLVGVFAVSGSLASLAGGLHGYSVATAAPDPGLAPLIFAITAVLLGGIRLSGGRGGALGVAAGVLVLSLLQELFAILATPEYVSSVITGGLLLIVAVIAAPDLIRLWQSMGSSVRTRSGPSTAPERR
jgi:ribose transport system permease protein